MRSRCFFLYSQPKRSRFQTSAQPSPPVVFVAPFSKAYHSPFGSAVVDAFYVRGPDGGKVTDARVIGELELAIEQRVQADRSGGESN